MGIEFTEFACYRISELAELPLWIIHIAWPIAGVSWILFLGGTLLRRSSSACCGSARAWAATVLATGQPRQILFGMFFTLLFMRVPVAVALGARLPADPADRAAALRR